MMDLTFKNKLEENPLISSAAIQILETEEIWTQAALDLLKEDQLRVLGMKTGSINAILEMRRKPQTSKQTSEEMTAEELGVSERQFEELLMRQANIQILWRLITIKTLVGKYNPANKDGLALYILKEALGDTPVMAFKPGTQEVAVDEVTNYITSIRSGGPQKQAIMVGGQLAPLYKVGICPWNIRREDPLLPGVALDENTCSTLHPGISFAGMPLNTLQMIRLAVESSEVNAQRLFEVELSMKIAEQGFDALTSRFVRAAMQFRLLEARGQLPRLEIYEEDANRAPLIEGSSQRIQCTLYNFNLPGARQRFIKAVADSFECNDLFRIIWGYVSDHPEAEINPGMTFNDRIVNILNFAAKHGKVDILIEVLGQENQAFLRRLNGTL